MATLYAAKAQSATSSSLYTLDSTTAAPTSIGATGHAITGLAFDPTNSTLYGVSSPQSTSLPNHLFTIDPLTGTATNVGALGGSVGDIAFDSTGNLWGWTQDSGHGGLSPSATNGALVSVNKATGAATAVADSTLNTSGSAVAINSADVLYAILKVGGAANLYTFNTGTGLPSFVHVLSAVTTHTYGAAAFDSTDVLYAMDTAGATLVTVGTTLGTRTVIGTAGADFDALAWSVAAPPAPTVEGVNIAFGSDIFDTSPDYVRLDD